MDKELVLSGEQWYNGEMYTSQYAEDADSAGWHSPPMWVCVQRLSRRRTVWKRTYYVTRHSLELERAVAKTELYIPF